MVWQPRGAVLVTVPACEAFALLNQGEASMMLDLSSIYPVNLKAMGRMFGKWQQFCCFDIMDQNRTGCVVKLGITTETEAKQQQYCPNLGIF